MRAITISFSLLLFLSTSAVATDLSSSDRAAVKRVYDRYVAAWLAGDADAVMKLLSDDAVLIPHHGLPPVVGAADIRKWWWPPNSPPTTINVFTVTHDQVGGSGRMAFVRGTQKLEWTTGSVDQDELERVKQSIAMQDLPGQLERLRDQYWN